MTVIYLGGNSRVDPGQRLGGYFARNCDFWLLKLHFQRVLCVIKMKLLISEVDDERMLKVPTKQLSKRVRLRYFYHNTLCRLGAQWWPATGGRTYTAGGRCHGDVAHRLFSVTAVLKLRVQPFPVDHPGLLPSPSCCSLNKYSILKEMGPFELTNCS